MKKKEKNDVKKMGVWIDHFVAILVSLDNEKIEISKIESNAESHFRHSGGCKSGNSVQSITKEKKAEERRTHQYHKFYQEIMQTFDMNTEILIFGPGEAKLELEKEIAKNHRGKIQAVETTDKLTDNQIVAKVKSFYKKSDK